MSEQATEFDRQLAAKGWSYDPATGEFREGTRRLEWEELIAALPGASFDALMAYERHQHQEWLKRLPPLPPQR